MDRRPIDRDRQSYRYYRNAVERHWDPGAIDLEPDRTAIREIDDLAFDGLRETLALFGAGETAVTEDLAPLAVVLEDVSDQLFLTTQLYEEAKHADFFERYWRVVIDHEAERRGLEPSGPTDDRWFSEAYEELFARNERAMHRLLEADTPANRAAAYAHYHLAIEGILAQTGYYAVQHEFDGSVPGVPEHPGLVEGFRRIRSDEGRHVGFGMWQLQRLVRSGAVDGADLEWTVGELVGLIQRAVGVAADDDGTSLDPGDLATYAARKHRERMAQIVEDDRSIPSVEELVEID